MYHYCNVQCCQAMVLFISIMVFQLKPSVPSDVNTHLENTSETISDHNEQDKEPPDKDENYPELETPDAIFPYVPETISLCGAVTLTEVKNLLQEWINSTDGKWIM